MKWMPGCLVLLFLLFSQTLWAAKGLDVSLANNSLLLTQRHGGDGSAWGLARCDNCHVLNSIHGDAPKIRELAKNKGYQTCAGCHGGNGTQAERRCVVCHNPADLPKSPVQLAPKQHDFSVNTVAPLQDKDCLVCHISSDMDGQFEINIDLTLLPNKAGFPAEYRNGSEFCLRCHNRDHQQPGFELKGYDYRHPMLAMEDNYNFIDKHGQPKGSGQRTYAGLRDQVYQYGSVVECTDCHAMHGTRHDKLIIDSSATGIAKFPDAFRQKPYDIAIYNGDYAQLCVTCHAMDKIVEQGAQNTGNGLSGVHEVNSDCRVCHTHGQAVQTGL